MKKLVVAALTLVMVLGLGVNAFAAPAEKELKVKNVDVDLATTVQDFEVIFVGDAVELEAVTLKKGSSFEDSWVIYDEEGNLVTKIEIAELGVEDTFLNKADFYVARAIFTASEAGVYTVRYEISMSAGKSHVRFNGNATSEPIDVQEEEEEVVLAVVRYDVEVTKIEKQNKNFDRIYYDVTAHFNDGTSKKSSFDNNIGKNENQAEFNVEFNVNGQKFKFKVTVKR